MVGMMRSRNDQNTGHVFGLAVMAVFLAMLILNAISY